MSIVVENLTHVYSEGGPFTTVAVRNVSLTVEDGDFLGLIGHTGSGKTTLVLHLNALLTPTSGRVLVDGIDAAAPGTDKREIRRRVGMVFQYPEHQLFEETVARDVGFGPRNLGLSAAEVDDRVREALQQVGLQVGEIGERSPFELSGGQMRRVAIAGVLAMRPEVLVLDEPAAGLDPAGRRALLEMIASLHRAGTTIVMVSHSMEDMANLATRLAVMAHGELVMSGTPKEVFGRGAALAEMGLDVPAAVRTADALRARGIPVPEDLFRMQDLENWVLARMAAGGNRQ